MDADAQQRLLSVVADAFSVPEGAVIVDAVVEARRLESYQLPPDVAREISDLQARVDLAVAQFRAGDLVAAEAQTELVLGRLRARPELPMASSMTWTLRVLQGRIAWTRADDAAASQAWRAAVAVDPEAQLSGREVPPDVVASYESVRAQVLGERAQWSTPELVGASLRGAEVEIDGVGGLRPVPAGEHFVVVHWPGARPTAVMVAEESVAVQRSEILIAAGIPADPVAADRVCERLALDVLVTARMREGRLGVQAYDCAGDFGSPWYSEGLLAEDPALAGLATATRDPDEYAQRRGVLLDAEPWPEPEPEVPPTLRPVVRGPDPGPTDEVAKPWFRRAWVWVVVGAVVAGSVTTGVVLGTRDPSSSVVITDDFLRP